MTEKRPAYQWYTGDWRKDAGVQACSIAARGLWREMLDIAHESEPRGELRINGLPMTGDQIGRVAGVPPRECKALVAELERYGVFSRRDDGAIYSRRMVRDERVRAARAAGGEAGKEHGDKGAEHGSKGGRPRKDTGVSKPPFEAPSEPPPSSSTSTSVKEETEATASAKNEADHVRPASRGTRLPADWRPDGEGREFAEQQGLDADATLAEFGDYWRAKPGAGGVKLDWPATWRNWCRHAAERRRSPQGTGRGRAGIGGVSVTQAVGEVVAAFRDRA